MFTKCTKIWFSNSQSTITGITLFPDEELFILALYFTYVNNQFPYYMFSSACLWSVFCEVMFMVFLYAPNFCGTAVLLEAEGNTKTAKLSLMFMFSLSFFSHVYLPASKHGPS